MSRPTPQLRTRIKVCGITRLEDALAASELGVDAVGFVFYPKSPRYIEPAKAAAIIRQLPPFVSAVGLFVNPDQAQIAEILKSVPLGVIQLHGDESPEFCQAQRRRVLKAIPVSGPDDLKRAASYNCPLLLDAKAPAGVYGGTGTSFDWSLLKGFKHNYPLSLAGGLNADNVKEALAVRQWFALDVSSGVETSPGIKSAEKMRAFIAAVNNG
ncbi:phosphoribosylanthranilate isomerase [Mariprofundus ferrinatatus]|uniref:N-(5'-phosphoribosyl)anthranilate isomerase n=1 Tax=Mariprofundus ferrinatatus TaxID=1921087 RepID=A0A2K8L741_9PROT|nr:phosphoribosylanthranilate isomerase [Mariprofundus ferrinatatus]ATX83073.1 phosphoribosylanthranilate isomerase [Mariprofundus ferrinatatus]